MKAKPLLPFSTQSVGDPSVKDLPLPTVILAVNVVLASTLHTLVYQVAVRRNGLIPISQFVGRYTAHWRRTIDAA